MDKEKNFFNQGIVGGIEKVEKKQTITYLNVIKAISIFLVVFCHMTLLKSGGYVDNISMLICWIGVPCFFMVNGALLFNKELNVKKHYKKVLTIYIVNIVWRIIYLILSTFILHTNIDFTAKSEIFKYIFCFKTIKGVNTGHLYFIEALISCYLIFPIFYNNYKTKEGKKCLAIFAVIIFCLTYGVNIVNFITKVILQSNKLDISGIRNILPFSNYAHYLVLFIIGGFLHEYREKIQNIKYIKILSVVLLIICLIGLSLIRYTDTKTFKWNGALLSNGYGRLCTFIMSISMFILIQGTEIKNRFVNKIVNIMGYSTLGIFYMHVPVLSICSQYLYRYIHARGVLINVLKSIVVIFVVELIIVILKKIPILKKLV